LEQVKTVALGKSRREFRWKSIAMVRVKCSLSYILPCFAERAN
jgi:hypothetical protein